MSTIDVTMAKRTQAEKREEIRKMLLDSPERSNRAIGRALDLSHQTVAVVRQEMTRTGQIPRRRKTVGLDGRMRRAKPRIRGMRRVRDSWGTPPELFAALHKRLKFSIDACAAAENALLPRYWSYDDDCREQDWRGERVFCNPPFRRAASIVPKATEAEMAVVLLPTSSLASQYIGDYPPDAIILPHYRIKFAQGNGEPEKPSSAPMGTVLLCYGDSEDWSALDDIGRTTIYSLSASSTRFRGASCDGANILLVEPPHPKGWGKWNQYHGLLKIGAWHKKRGDTVQYQVGLQKTPLPDIDKIYVASLISYWEPHYIKTIVHYRERYPDAQLIFGGIYAINAHQRVKLWEEKYGITVQPFFPEAVDEIPDISLIGSSMASLLTSRGCPNNCSYCSSSNIYGKGWCPRPIGEVIEEIKVQVDRGAKEFALYDDNFFFQAEAHAIPLLEEITKLRETKLYRPIKFSIPSGFQASHMTAEIAQLMHKANFRGRLATGLESVNADVRKKMKRGTWSDGHNLGKCVRYLQEAGYKPNTLTVFFICGLPYQTIEDMLDTAVYISKLVPVDNTLFSRVMMAWIRSH